MTAVSLADCRAAARAVRVAEYGRQAIAVVRPRSVLGIVRSRGPLSVVLWVAAAEGRFVRSGPDSFALLERPRFVEAPAAARGALRLRLLRLVDRRWDTLLFAAPPAVLLATAVGLSAPAFVGDARPPIAVLWVAVAAMLHVTVFMTAQVAYGSAWLRRTLGRRPPAPDELAEESYPGWNWSMPLCHHTGAAGERLLRLASDRMERLVAQQARMASAEAGVELTDHQVRAVLVCLTRGVTTEAMRRTVARNLLQPYGPDARVALRLPLGPVRDYRAPVKAGGGFFFTWLGGIAVVIVVLAGIVADIERQACADSCAGRPATFATALHWAAWRLLWQDAPGVSAGTLRASAFGWLLGVVGLMTVVVAWTSARLAIDRHRKVLDDFERLKGPLANTRVLLLTVTDTERDAVLRTVLPLTKQETPERSFTGNVVTYELGAIGRTTLGMVQCAQMGAGGPGGAHATTTEAIRKWRPDLIVMVGICYGLREDWTPPQRLTDVIVATAIYDLDLRIEYDDHAEPLGDRVRVRSFAVDRLRAASTDWDAATVWFGLLLSSQALIDSAAYRDRLKAEHSRALGGEMEAQGLYAAASDAGVPWVVVKAISDWGVDRDRHYRPAEAAARAAEFVAHAVGVGAFDELPTEGARR